MFRATFQRIAFFGLGCTVSGCAARFEVAATPSGVLCTDMEVIPSGQPIDRPYHRLKPVASSLKATTEAERLESLRRAACKLHGDAVIEAVVEDVRRKDGTGYATRASGTAIQWVRNTGQRQPLAVPPPPPPTAQPEPPPLPPPASDEKPKPQPPTTEAQQAEVEACYARVRGRDPELKGQLTLRITINKQGKVTATEIEEDSLGSSDLNHCVLAATKAWRFPSPEGGIAFFSVPFSLSPPAGLEVTAPAAVPPSTSAQQ